MATVHDILSNKGTLIHRVPASASAMDAIMKMNFEQIGALVVEDDGKIVGIFTERDVLRRVVAEGHSPDSVPVSKVMTSQVICVGPDTDLDEVSAIMKFRRIRHLPVCDDAGRLIGLVSIGDVNAHYASNQQQTIHFLSDYIYGRV